MATERTVKTTLIANVSGYVQGIEQAANKTKELGSESEKLAQKKEAFNQLGQSGLAIGALAAAGVTLAVAKFADFDAAMSNVKAATQETSENMYLLRDAALDAGGETVFSAAEAAQAIEELGKAGLTTADILKGGLSGALDLAAAGQIDVARAAEITAITLQQFKLSGDRATDVADLLAAGAGKAAGGVEELAQALGQSALVAASTGLSVEETTGVLTAFASAGLLGSDAGTSLKTALQRLTPQSKEAKDEMERLGISAYDASGQFIGAANLAGELEDGFKGLTDEQRNASMAIIFGSDAVRAASILYEEGAEGIKDWIEAADDSGYAAKVAADRLDNLKGDVEKLGGAFDTALINSGGGANDMLREIVQSATFLVDAMGDVPTPVLDGATAVGAMASAIALTGGAALLAVPKIAEMKTALQTMSITAKSASISVGLAGGAIGAATILLGEFIGKQSQLAGQADSLADSFDQTTGAFTDYSRELLVANLEAEGAFDQAKRLGISQSELVDVILEGGDAWRTLDERMTAVDKDARGLQDTKRDLTDTAREQSSVVDQARLAWENEQEAMGGAAEASEETSVALESATAAAAAAEQAVQDLSDTLRNFGGVEMDARAAARELESAIDDATAALEENGATLDIGTQAGRNNQAALDAIAEAANQAAAAIYDQTGSVEDSTVALETGRQKYIEVGQQMGLTEEQAIAYADALIATPDAVVTQVKLTGVEAAKAALATFYAEWQGKSITVDFFANTYGLDRSAAASAARYTGQALAAAGGNANGGIYAYADGGIAEGIYSGGTPLYKFAEPETRWEAFISGKPGQENRNREIWKDAGARLGMAPAAGPTSVSLAGARLTMDVDGRQISAVIRDQIVEADRSGRVTIENGKKRYI